jgi:hypothetical protein
MLHERSSDKWLLDANLQSALDLWHKAPNDKEYFKKVEWAVNTAIRQGTLSIKIKKEVVGRMGNDNFSITKTAAERYSKVEGQLVVFETSKEIKARVGFIKDEAFLMLDSIHEPTFAFFKPQDIVSMEYNTFHARD